MRGMITVLIMISLLLAATGCTDTDEEPDDSDVITSVEARIFETNDPSVHFDIKARNLNHDLFDFRFEGEDEEGYIQVIIYNREKSALYEYEFERDLWYKFSDRRGVDSGELYWNQIEMLVEDIEEQGTDGFTYRGSDPDTGHTVSYTVDNIHIDRDIPGDYFLPPPDAIIEEPGIGPT